ncbi:MAG: crotonase [bacterium]|nr:crotonase [Deltaproteobacteria bacterium]MCP4904504.1 crotonase [bacterium]
MTCTRIEEQGGVAILTLDRPEKLNAWNDQMEAEIFEGFRELEARDRVRCIVVTGAGRAFCAGADLSAGASTFADFDGGAAGPVAPLYPWDLRKPVIAAVNGHAVGVGLTFAMACDVRYVALEAKLSFAFVRRGVIPGYASHVTVARAIGFSRAAELLLSGRMMQGSEAVEWGLASQALPADQVLDRAIALGQEIATHSAPVSVALSKQLLWDGFASQPGAMKQREDELFSWVGDQSDAGEGVAAFLEKRAPRWSMSALRDWPRSLFGSRSGE